MSVHDAQYNWVEQMPQRVRPYLMLARVDRPIGTWLLLWPCLWALFLASHQQGAHFPSIQTLVFVIAGAMLMRGAGCTLNDIIDRDYDKKVYRAMQRPLAAGTLSLRAAWVFLFGQLIFASQILFFFNTTSIWLGCAVLPIVALYPFMKRITFWPQLWLGLAFNWGALLGWAIVTNSLDVRALLLYIGGVFWTLGYDTIYAHQDREDDALIGIKSTALLFGENTKTWLSFFYLTTWACFTLANPGSSALHLASNTLMLMHLAWQVRQLDIHNAEKCLALFRSNRLFGLIVWFYFIT